MIEKFHQDKVCGSLPPAPYTAMKAIEPAPATGKAASTKAPRTPAPSQKAAQTPTPAPSQKAAQTPVKTDGGEVRRAKRPPGPGSVVQVVAPKEPQKKQGANPHDVD